MLSVTIWPDDNVMDFLGNIWNDHTVAYYFLAAGATHETRIREFLEGLVGEGDLTLSAMMLYPAWGDSPDAFWANAEAVAAFRTALLSEDEYEEEDEGDREIEDPPFTEKELRGG
jgi:hypothetical protein